MKNAIHIALVGDYNPTRLAHVAIPRAIELTASELGCKFEFTWLPTDSPDLAGSPQLDGYDSIWCVPGSPYASTDGALHAITFARTHNIPFLGTCGGCQYALVEYARNVLGLTAADHAETNPAAELILIAPLLCTLVEAHDRIKLIPGTHIADLYGKEEIVEQYHCSFGPSIHYQSLLEDGKMRIAGLDSEGQARAFELTTHPFFMLTLFQPERSAFSQVVHPLIRAFVQATRRVSVMELQK